MIVRGIPKSKIANKFRNGFVKLMKNRSFSNCELKSPRCNLWNSKSPKLGFEDIGRRVDISDYFSLWYTSLSVMVGNCYWLSSEKRYLCLYTSWPHVVNLHPSLPLPVVFTFHIFCYLKFFSKGFFLKVALGIHPAMITASIVPNIWRVWFRKTYIMKWLLLWSK